jgi:hypothetical protein
VNRSSFEGCILVHPTALLCRRNSLCDLVLIIAYYCPCSCSCCRSGCSSTLVSSSAGVVWFQRVCCALGHSPAATYRSWLAAISPDLLKGPFNHGARQEVGLPRSYYDVNQWPQELQQQMVSPKEAAVARGEGLEIPSRAASGSCLSGGSSRSLGVVSPVSSSSGSSSSSGEDDVSSAAISSSSRGHGQGGSCSSSERSWNSMGGDIAAQGEVGWRSHSMGVAMQGGARAALGAAQQQGKPGQAQPPGQQESLSNEVQCLKASGLPDGQADHSTRAGVGRLGDAMISSTGVHGEGAGVLHLSHCFDGANR